MADHDFLWKSFWKLPSLEKKPAFLQHPEEKCTILTLAPDLCDTSFTSSSSCYCRPTAVSCSWRLWPFFCRRTFELPVIARWNFFGSRCQHILLFHFFGFSFFSSSFFKMHHFSERPNSLLFSLSPATNVAYHSSLSCFPTDTSLSRVGFLFTSFLLSFFSGMKTVLMARA